MQEDNHQKCMAAAMPNWSSITNYGYHPLGRLWFCYSDQFAHEYSSYDLYVCVVQNPGTGEQFVCSAVYACNTVAVKTQLEENLRGIRAAYDHLGLSWIVLGDFSEVFATSERSRAMDYRMD